MDVSVKQAYDRLITVCNSLDDIKQFEWTKEIRRNIAEDVYGFIKLISKKNADDRYYSFDKECQNNQYPNVDMIEIEPGSVPRRCWIKYRSDRTRFMWLFLLN